ncbi:MAG: hypothetical protein IPM35_41655 [Myxococcales bacterium]|nr:hypothetical protein [Myxococcales bacterium]
MRLRRARQAPAGAPGTAVVGVFDAPVKMFQGATQGYESVHHWDERMKLETGGHAPRSWPAARPPGLGPELMREPPATPTRRSGACRCARGDHRARRPVRRHAAIEYGITDADIRVLKLGVRRLTEMMFAAGARAVLPGVHGLPHSITSVDVLSVPCSTPPTTMLVSTPSPPTCSARR